MVVFPKRPNTCGAELDPLILKQYVGTVIIIKEFTAGDFKASHIKISRNQCDARGQGCIRLLLIGRMDTGGRLVIIRRLKSSPAGIDGHKPSEQTAVDHPQLREDGAVAILGVVQKMLNRNEIISGNDALVVVPVKALGSVPPILSGLVVQIVGGEGLPGQHIPAMPLIAKDLDNGVGCPLDIPQISLPAQLGERRRNVGGGISVQIHIEDEFYRGGFIRVDDQVSICVVRIPQQLGRQWQTSVQPHPQGGLHAPAADVRLLLSHGGLKRKRHLGIVFEGEDTFALKEYPDRTGQLRKHTNHADTVHHIPGKARHAFGDDHIDFPAAAIGDHAVELVPMSQRSSANPLIRIDFDQCPVGMMHNKIFIVFLLQLIGGSLLDIVCGDTGIHGDPLPYIIIVIVDGLFSRNEFIVLRVNFCVDTPADPFFPFRKLFACGLVNHAAFPSGVRHQGVSSNRDLAKSRGRVDPPGNRKPAYKYPPKRSKRPLALGVLPRGAYRKRARRASSRYCLLSG